MRGESSESEASCQSEDSDEEQEAPIYNSLFLCSKLQITRSYFCVYTSYIQGICTMQGEEHLGNATFQALFIVNNDHYQTNWHQVLIILQLINWGRFFLASHVVKGKIQLLLLTKYCECPTRTEVEKCPHLPHSPRRCFSPPHILIQLAAKGRLSLDLNNIEL